MRNIIRFVLVFTILSLFAGSVVLAQNTTPKSSTSCKKYNISIKGYVGGSKIERTGRLGVYKPGLSASNQEELWIVSGNPVESPSKGAFRFTTNSFFNVKNSYSYEKFDMAGVTVEYSPKTFDISPSFAMANNTFGKVNLYTQGNTKSSTRAINRGKIQVEFKSGNKVSGWIQVYDEYQSGTYNVTFTGSLDSSSSTSKCQFHNN
jgi:hypothetical protein